MWVRHTWKSKTKERNKHKELYILSSIICVGWLETTGEMSLKGKIRHTNVQYPIKFYFFPPHKRNLYNSWRNIYRARWWLTDASSIIDSNKIYPHSYSNFLHLVSAIVSNAINCTMSWYVSLVEPTVKMHWMNLFIGSLHMSSNVVCNSYLTISLELYCVPWESEREKPIGLFQTIYESWSLEIYNALQQTLNFLVFFSF